MDAVVLAADLELREDDRELAVLRRVADVVLRGGVVGGAHDDLVGGGVVGGGRAERLDVAAVAGLGHREAAESSAREDVGQVALVVGARPSWSTAPPKSPNWTPDFTTTDRSP